MLLGICNKNGAAPVEDAAVDDFSLDGQRAVTTERHGALLIATTAGPPFPPTAGDSDGQRIVCASGEAYDPGSGTSTLAAYLLDAYRREGAALTPPRNGSFTFVAHDKASNELVLGNDAFGFYPLWVLDTDRLVAFCTEVEPLIRLMPAGPKLDADAVAQFFVFGATLGSKTFVSGVANLEPGTILTVRDGRVSRRCHDPLDIKVVHGRTLEEYASEVGEAFRRAVDRRMEKYPQMTAGLTGGADTRLNLSCMSAAQRQRTRFFTHYAQEGAADRDRDVLIARKVAAKAGVRHEAEFKGPPKPLSAGLFQALREREPRLDHLQGTWGGEYLGGCAVDVGLFPVRRVTCAAIEAKAQRLLSPDLLAKTSDLFEALQNEYNGIQAENREFLFWIRNFSRPFFTNLYARAAGSTNAWMMPWMMCVWLNSPHQDADFLRALLAVPFEFVSGYRLYNAIYTHCFPEMTGVPTNSGLAVRSDSALKMYVEGEEPKKARRAGTGNARRAAFQAVDSAGDIWRRGVFARDEVTRRCLAETAPRDKPTLTTRLKDRYTASVLFRARHHLPLHAILMRWKARKYVARTANLQAPLVGAVVHFEYWCEHAGIRQ